MHLRPADFFTSNPALDVPSTRNDTSVLVQCCGNKSAQQDPLSHLQGAGSDIAAKEAGANVEGENGKGEGNDAKLGRRLSRALTDLLKLKTKE
jgi:primary-amine oxidase